MKALLLAAFVLCPASAGAEISVTATLNHERVAVGDQLVLSVAIAGSGTASPKMPLIPDVEIYESGKSQSMSIINGNVASRVVLTYILAPRKPGRFVVPPIEVSGSAPTAPIPFTVVPVAPDDLPPAATKPGAAAPPAPDPPPAATTPLPPPPPQTPPQPPRAGGPAPDAFVTAALEKNKPYVNEQVNLVVRFFTAVPLLGAPQYDAPKLNGLLSENLGAEGQGSTVIGGRTYNYSELKSALFPVQAGAASIGPAVVTVQLPRRGAPNTGDDFFDRFFSMSAPEARRLQTEPLTLHAEALPPGAPDDFSGIVGSLTVSASVDRKTVKAGEALTLTVTVSGVGNIKSLAQPKRPELASLRFFEPESSVKLERDGDRIGGTKIFKTVVVPRVSGPLEIPPLTLSYFDPEKKAYARAQSAAIRLDVQPGDPNAALPVVGPGASAPGVTEVSSDIRYLKTPGGRSALGDALAAFGAGGPWHALPVAFFLFALIRDWRRRSLESDPRGRRARNARDTALRLLGQAESQPAAERARAVALLGEALTGYFADAFDQPAAGLTLKAVLHRLQNQRAVPAASALTRLKSIWDELDLLRYAPSGAGQAEVKRLAEEIRALTLEFDRERKS